MSVDRFEKLKNLLENAIDLPAAERKALLDVECGDDVTLRADVELLLAVEEEEEEGEGDTLPLEPTPPVGSGQPQPTTEKPGGPKRIGRYPVLHELGRGGMGLVYAAEDPELRRRIAIKVLPDRLAESSQWLRTFRREARLLAAINHPNIATIHSLERDGNLQFLTMEWIAGSTLEEEAGEEPVTRSTALRICRQIAAALEAAHKREIVHRDLKPANVMIGGDGHVKVLDFGIAKASQPDRFESIAGAPSPVGASEAADEPRLTFMSAGTPGYMSPEQALGGWNDFRTDIWALGCTLYFCLTGTAPFPGRTGMDRIRTTLKSDPDWNALPSETSDGLRELLRACLSKNRRERPDSMTAVGEILEAELSGVGFQSSGRPVKDSSRFATVFLDEDGSEARSEIESGSILAGRYRIEEFLDRGGMGDVYRAQDLDLQVPVAIKTIGEAIAEDPASLRRFKQEVLLARSISHPNVCKIFDLGRDEKTGIAFLTMELLEGQTLAARIEDRGPLDLEEVLSLTGPLADALDAAHSAGVIHRDFKSQNVMIARTEDGERPVILDFGLAVPTVPSKKGDTESRFGSPSGAEPLGASISGTPPYMSPEQARGGIVGPASDLYALGVVLYEMVSGTLPFRGETPAEIVRTIVTEVPRPLNGDVPLDAGWEQAILRLLAKEPGERFGSAADVLLALQGSARGGGTTGSIPAERDLFVGRGRELEKISVLEEPEGPRLLTLLGLGGTGKTRLSLQYGRRSASQWPGGVWFCDLSDVSTVEGLAVAVARGLGLSLGREDPITQIGRSLSGRGRCLVILDNFEQIVEFADSTLGRWIERAEDARFLVTSRSRLRLPGESLQELEPLDPATEGAELFMVRAQQHRPSLDRSNDEVIREISTLLDGIPLALELAAARLRVLSLTGLRDRLEDRFRVLVGGAHGRHETLTTTLDWSWELLDPWERSAVSQLSVFDGGFTLGAAECVLDLGLWPDAPFELDILQALLDKSWLRSRADGEEVRFDMFATVREYAARKLESGASDEPDSRASVEQRHGEFFSTMGTVEAIDSLSGPRGVIHRKELRQELDNLMVACRRAIGRGDAETAYRTYIATSTALVFQGPFSVGIPLGREVAELVSVPALQANVLRALGNLEQLMGELDAAYAHCSEALEIARGADARRVEAVALVHLATIDRIRGHADRTRHALEEALTIARDLGDHIVEAHALTHFALFEEEQDSGDVSLALYESALERLRANGDRCGEAIAVGNLGILYQKRGRIAESRTHYESALELHRELGDRHFEANVLLNLATTFHEQGMTKEAFACYETSLALEVELGNRRMEAICLGNLGNLYAELGHEEKAESKYTDALRAHRDVGDRSGAALVLTNLGNSLARQGQLDRASECLREALEIARDVGNRRLEGVVIETLGGLCREENRTEEAHQHYELALSLHREVGNARRVGIALGCLASTHIDLGRLEEARHCLEQSEEILRDLRDLVELSKTICALGDLAFRNGDLLKARNALSEAESLMEEVGATESSELGEQVQELRASLGGSD